MTYKTTTPEQARIREILTHTVTRYDRAQEKKKHYNIYALPQYLQACDRAFNRYMCDHTIEESLEYEFCGPLLDTLKKAISLNKIPIVHGKSLRF